MKLMTADSKTRCDYDIHPNLQKALRPLLHIHLADFKLMEVIDREGIKKTYTAELPLFGSCIYRESNQFCGYFLQNSVDRKNTKKYMRLALIFQIRHENILTFYGLVTEEGKTTGFVTELASLKTLEKYIQPGDTFSNYLKISQILRWSMELASAVAHCHGINVVHGDIQPKNIFLTDDESSIKLGNFNFELNPDPTHTIRHSRQDFSAPEVILGTKFSPASDVYSFGMVLYSLIYQRMPFTGSKAFLNNPLNFRNFLETGGRPPFEEHCNLTAELRRIIEDCWKTVPAERPSMKEVLQRLCSIDKSLSMPIEEKYETKTKKVVEKMEEVDEMEDWDVVADQLEDMEIV